MARAIRTLSKCACLIFVVAIPPTFAEGIPRDTLEQLKRATVLIRTGAGATATSGSGFLLRTDSNRGYVVT